MKKLGILRFLGTNCDQDIWQAGEEVGLEPEWLWYQDQFQPNEFAALVVPGGFSYGDYLRAGALASKSPVIKSLLEADQKGIPIIGICNGFQILCETGILPGALVQNESRRFIDIWQDLIVTQKNSYWASSYASGQVIQLPIAHGEGRYYLEDDDLKRILDSGQVWLKYRGNPNGSIEDIAGVTNERGNTLGLMPHPERAMFQWMGGEQGVPFFADLMQL